MSATYLSQEGYDKLLKEFDRLKKLKIKLSHDIGEALAQGDLRENAGYKAAKDRQAETLRRIAEIEGKLHSATMIEGLKVAKDEVRIGAKVTFEMGGEKITYEFVGADESDPAGGKISVDSPLAQGMLGAKAGQEVTVTLPAGKQKVKIVKVKY